GDGESARAGCAQYITERLGGLQSSVPSPERASAPRNYPLLVDEFPNFMAQYQRMYRQMWMPPEIPREDVDEAIRSSSGERAVVTGPITYEGQAQVQRDIRNFRDALDGLAF